MNLKIQAILWMFLFITNESVHSQTAKQIHTFPEDFVGKTITFDNTRYWPILKEFDGYYTVQINITEKTSDPREWGFQTLNKIIGVVDKKLAKKMIQMDVGGYNINYSGSVTGKVIESDKIFGSEYLFLIIKLVNYPPNEPYNVVEIFDSEN